MRFVIAAVDMSVASLLTQMAKTTLSVLVGAVLLYTGGAMTVENLIAGIIVCALGGGCLLYATFNTQPTPLSHP